MTDDTRNVTDEFKGVPIGEIITQLDARGVSLEVAIENLSRDYNMGTIVRSANAFGVRRIHIVGRRQWNKRGAMMTDKYLHVVYHSNVQDFVKYYRPTTPSSTTTHPPIGSDPVDTRGGASTSRTVSTGSEPIGMGGGGRAEDGSMDGDRWIVAVDNVAGSVGLQRAELPSRAVLVFGSEGEGLSCEMLAAANQIIAIEQLGSTRSLNVGVAAGIAMYEWLRRQESILDKIT